MAFQVRSELVSFVEVAPAERMSHVNQVVFLLSAIDADCLVDELTDDMRLRLGRKYLGLSNLFVRRVGTMHRGLIDHLGEATADETAK